LKEFILYSALKSKSYCIPQPPKKGKGKGKKGKGKEVKPQGTGKSAEEVSLNSISLFHK